MSAGDTLSSISRRYRLPQRDITFLNGLKRPYNLYIGQRLKLPPPREYNVQQGDTVQGIARLFAVDAQEIVQLNQLRSPFTIRVGQVLNLPSTVPEPETKVVSKATPSQKVARVKSGVPMPEAKPRREVVSRVTTPAPKRSSSKFMKPVPGKIISSFGSKKNGLRNDGINIEAPRGTPVKAAENGVVVYAGNALKGSGNLILVRHDNQWMSAYAHLETITATKGQTLKRGDVLGKVGSTGSVSSPQLHFEVRRGTSAVNPLTYLE